MTDSTDLIDVARAVALHSYLFDTVRYLIAAVPIAVLVWALGYTSWRSRRIQARRARLSDYRRELLLSLRTIAVFTISSVLTVWAARHGWLAHIPEPTPLRTLGGLLAMLVVHDAYFYWTHRAMHHPRLFKVFHRTHHRSVTPTPFAAYAFDVPEAALMAAFMPLWLALVPTPLPAVFLFLAIMILRNVMAHAGLELHARGWASHPALKWISTTTHHDLHHSGSFRHNYGFYSTFWDKVMGTEHPGYVQAFDEVTARPAPSDSPRVPGRLVMGAFGGIIAAVLVTVIR